MKIFKFHSDIGRVHQLIGLAVFALFYVLLATVGEHKMYYESINHLFRYSADFFRENWKNIPGLFYLNQFLLQFFIFPYLGAAIVVGLYVLIYRAVRGLLVRVGCSAVFAHYLVLAMLVVFQWWQFMPTYGFRILVPVALFYGAISGYCAIGRRGWKVAFALASLWVLPFFIGVWTWGVALFFISEAILNSMNFKGFGAFAGFLVGVLVSIFLPPYIWQHTIFTILYSDILLKSGLAFKWSYAVLCISAFVPFVLILKVLWIPRITTLLRSYVGIGLFAITFGIAGYLVFTTKTITLLNLYYKMERDIQRHDWDAVLSGCRTYLALVEDEEDKGQYFGWVIDNTKFALSLTHELLEDFFSFSNHAGFGILFPQALEQPDKDHPGVYNYFLCVGLQAETIHSAFERIISGAESPPTLEKLIQSHAAFGDYRPCVEFIRMLEESLFYRKQARAYRQLLADTAAIGNDPFYARLRELQPQIEIQTSWTIDYDMAGLALSNLNNQYAVEYAFASALSYKQHSVILTEIDSLLTHFDYAHIPRHLEEALLIHLEYGADPQMDRDKVLSLDFAGHRIREETVARCDEFFKLLDRYNMGMAPFSTVTKRFGDTYWYHFLFIELKRIELRGQNSYDIS